MGLFRWWRALLAVPVLLTAAVGIGSPQPLRPPDPKARPAGREDQPKPPAPSADASPPPAGDKKGGVLSLEALKLPAGAVLVLYEEAKEALRLLPKAVVMTPEEYQKLLDQIEHLKRQATPDKPDIPSTCRLTGRVEGDLVYLQARFEFWTDRPGAFVNLGCQRAWATDARLDEQLPWLRLGEEGYMVQVEKPGAHTATLDLVLPLVTKRGAKGADRGFDLDLPRAAITNLEHLDLPHGVPEVRMGNRPVRSKNLDSLRRLENVPVAPIDHLDLSWKGPAPELFKGPPLLAATGRIQVQLNEARAVTDAKLTLQVLRGETAQWRIWAPPLPPGETLEITPDPQDEARVLSIDRPVNSQDAVVTIRLKEPSAEPLRVTLRVDHPRPGNTVPIGPFIVVDALTQKGDLEVRAPDDLRLRYQMSPELGQREVSEEQRRDGVKAAFTFWALPAPPKPRQPAAALLTLQMETVPGAAETRVNHHLHSLKTDADGRPRWRLTTTLEVTPIRTAIDRIQFSLPVEYEYDSDIGPVPADLVEEVLLDRQKRTGQVKLASKQVRTFSVTLEGSYALPLDRREASLELPRPLTWSVERAALVDKPATPLPGRPAFLERGGQVTLHLPEGLELMGRSPSVNPEEEAHDTSRLLLLPVAVKPALREYTWRTEKSPERVELAWRPRRSELTVNSVVDITLADRHARVRQQIRFPEAASGEVQLRGPTRLLERVRITSGGELSPDEAKISDLWPVHLKGAVGEERLLTLEYAVLLTESADLDLDAGIPRNAELPPAAGPSRRLSIPLVQPSQATRGETRIRLWSEAGEQLSVGGGAWEELPTEVVPERDSLPTLVLRGSLPGSSSLQLTARAGTPIARAVVERTLVRAVIDEGRSQTYVARFLLTKLNARHLDVDLPVALSRANVEVRLDGKQIIPQFRDESGREVDIGKVARLSVEPRLYPRPVVLDLGYQLDPSRADGNGPLRVTLRPPSLRGAVVLGRSRWQVDIPAGWMPLLPEERYALERRWEWQGLLLTPRPTLTNVQLEQWFNGSDAPPHADDGEPSAVSWQSTLAPLQLILLPRRFWLLACSLVFLALGLGLFFTRYSPAIFWICVAFGCFSLFAIALLWPAALSIFAYGCEPGVVMLLLVIGMHWVLQHRYRRRVAFMPGFTRLKPGSSLILGNSANRAREPSTVDRPPKHGSSVIPELPSSPSAS